MAPARGARRPAGRQSLWSALLERELADVGVALVEQLGAARQVAHVPVVDLLGLQLDGPLVSSCTLTVTPNLTRGTRPYGLIENVVTHANFRRRGLGQQLIDHALQMAWQQRCYKVMLLTGQQAAHHFYEECGFRKGIKTGFVAYPE